MRYMRQPSIVWIAECTTCRRIKKRNKWRRYMNKKGMKSEGVGCGAKKRRPRFIQKCDWEERFWGLTRLRAWKFLPKVRSPPRNCLKKQTPINFRAFFNEKKSLELGQADNASRKKNPATDFAIVINVINSNVHRGWAVCLSSLLRENWDFWRSRVILKFTNCVMTLRRTSQ